MKCVGSFTYSTCLIVRQSLDPKRSHLDSILSMQGGITMVLQRNSRYPMDYQPLPIAEQVARLRKLFPELGPADEKLAELPLPPNAEGYFAIPRWRKINPRWRGTTPSYGEAIERIFYLIKQARNGNFHNEREGSLGNAHLRRTSKTAKALEMLAEQQNDHNILVVPAQFGLHHWGKQVREARAAMDDYEFALGTFEISCMLLTHPKRLQNENDLWIDCAGDEFTTAANGTFNYAPHFRYPFGRLVFDAFDDTNIYPYYGSPSVFLHLAEKQRKDDVNMEEVPKEMDAKIFPGEGVLKFFGSQDVLGECIIEAILSRFPEMVDSGRWECELRVSLVEDKVKVEASFSTTDGSDEEKTETFYLTPDELPYRKVFKDKRTGDTIVAKDPIAAAVLGFKFNPTAPHRYK